MDLHQLRCFVTAAEERHFSYVPAYPPVTEETSFRVKQGLAARGNVDFGTVPAGGSVLEVAKWLVRIEVRNVLAPFFWLLLEVASEIPSRAYRSADAPRDRTTAQRLPKLKGANSS